MRIGIKWERTIEEMNRKELKRWFLMMSVIWCLMMIRSVKIQRMNHNEKKKRKSERREWNQNDFWVSSCSSRVLGTTRERQRDRKVKTGSSNGFSLLVFLTSSLFSYERSRRYAARGKEEDDMRMIREEESLYGSTGESLVWLELWMQDDEHEDDGPGWRYLFLSSWCGSSSPFFSCIMMWRWWWRGLVALRRRRVDGNK